MKKVSSRVIKTSPFFERRVREESLKIKFRRAEDNTQSNISDLSNKSENQAINPGTYEFSPKRVKTAARNCSGVKILDFYA